MKKYTFHVNGMHCASCVALTESELSGVPEVSRAKASLGSRTVDVTGDFGDKTAEHIARDLSVALAPHGYTLSVEKREHRAAWYEFRIALPAAAVCILIFLFLQKLGLVNLVTASEVGYGTAFLIGVIASLSTCMAVVGGLALSISANFAKEGEKVRPQMLFHIGRLLSFFLLGGAVGMLGVTFHLGTTGTLVLGLLVASVLIILGVNLLDVFPKLKKWQPSLPGGIGKRVHGFRTMNHAFAPFLVGAATFFLPCGFTQSMQIYTLTTGSFSTGALIMFFFALGTLPVLALLSFGSVGIGKARSGIFFKTAGLVVIFFGIFNGINALVGADIIAPIFGF